MKVDSHSRLSASEFVADTLRREILQGELLPGQPLPQDRIASRFDVSQSSVREALRRLEALSLVVSIRNRGAFVSGLTIEQVEELYEIRIALEVMGLRHNFAAIGTEQLNEARAILDRVDQGDEVGLLGAANRQFHAIFYESPDRKFGKDFLDLTTGNLTRAWADVVKKRPRIAHQFEMKSRREHRVLLEAVVGRDLSAAEKILEMHIASARDALVDQLRESGGVNSHQQVVAAQA